MKKLRCFWAVALAATTTACSGQPEPKDKWKPENVSHNEFGNQE